MYLDFLKRAVSSQICEKSVDIVARIGREPWDMLTQQADNVYQLGNPELCEQNFGRVPIRVK